LCFFFVTVVLTLSGCESSHLFQQSAAFYHHDPARHVAVIDRQEISVMPRSENTWEAYGGNPGKETQPTGNVQQRQIKAIETVSLCKVVSSGYDVTHEKDQMLLTTQVDCSAK
jgi:hypothetical protein